MDCASNTNKNTETGVENQLSPLRSLTPDSSPLTSCVQISNGDRHEVSEESSLSTSSSSSSLNTSTSLSLNPNSTIDNEDLVGIALLKEIFPEESTDVLRELHYQHIMANKTQCRPGNQKSLPEDLEKGERFILPQKECSNTAMAATTTTHHQYRMVSSAPLVALPNDFLRLPTSVAVVREVGGELAGSRYEFLQDLESQALHEYQLAAWNSKNSSRMLEDIEYRTFAVQKDERWGLGMTLQEEEQGLQSTQQNPAIESAATRYELKVVGFLPDPQKLRNGEIKSSITNSPAERAGIRLDDVLFGINGSAFLLPPLPLSRSKHEVLNYYEDQKAKIVESIQKSPNPVVVHVRRQRREDVIEQPKGCRRTSLLDTTFDGRLGGYAAAVSTPQIPSIPYECSPQFPSSPDLIRQPPDLRPAASIHPLAEALMKRKLILSKDDQWRVTFRLHQFTERARQWEALNALRLDANSLSLVPYFDENDLPPDMAALMVFSSDKEEVGKASATFAGDDGRNTTVDLDLDYSEKHQAFWGAICTPSTPPLPPDSSLIPVEYLVAYYGVDFAQMMKQENTAEKEVPEASSRNLPASRQLFQSRSSWDPFENNHNQETYPGKYSRGKAVTKPLPNFVLIPLYGIRKSLSARVVNSFVEESPGSNENASGRMAYTMWVYDTESGREWYAPVRYWKDFSDLRDAALGLLHPTSNIHQELSSLKFPKEITIHKSNGLWNSSVFSKASPLSPLQDRRRRRQVEDFEHAREQSAYALEEFLRELLGTIYTCKPLHPNVAEVSLYVQSFLGVDAGLAEEAVVFTESKMFTKAVDRAKHKTQQHLKRSIQRYTWRIFLLHTMKAIVMDFVDSVRSRGPKLRDIEALEAQGRGAIKSRAMEELARIQAFLDHMVDLVLDGCGEDLRMIAKRPEYGSVHSSCGDEGYWNCLLREAVREQIEIEVYVPLRGVVSRLLVSGWRHEDIEAHFKMKELRKRPQRMFRIPEDKVSPSNWQSVAHILRKGVGMSTLPCVKLKAIVESAKEISRLHVQEHGEGQILGADDFLPIFIYSVIRADMERPYALCVLLRTLCDRTNNIGEIGYFLASFEAAIAHIHEIDLTEDREEMLSLLSSPLTEISLNE